jgi:hypothetical protein
LVGSSSVQIGDRPLTDGGDLDPESLQPSMDRCKLCGIAREPRDVRRKQDIGLPSPHLLQR